MNRTEDSAGRTAADGQSHEQVAGAVIPLWEPAFFGDSSRLVKEVQSETYPELARALFRAARDRYLDACALVSVDTMLARLVRVVRDEDIAAPVLARAYRKVAAFYRFALVGEPQLELGASNGHERPIARRAWEEFVTAEARRLAAVNEMTTALLRAVAYRNTATGRAAEAHLVDLLAERYGRFTLRRRMELLRLSLDAAELDNWRFVEDVDWDQEVLDPRVRPNPPD